jgi:polysaccharide export outer membrane protein
MKRLTPISLPALVLAALLLAAGCTSQKKLAYLNNLPEPDGQESFTINYPDYRIQQRDVLYITAKALTIEGKIEDLLSSTFSSAANQMGGGDAGNYLYGYDVNLEGYIRIPMIGNIKIEGLTLDETRKVLQTEIDKVFKNTTVECRLISFKFTVIGEVRAPGTYINNNNYLTVFEAIGRAGGISDFGRRNRVLVVRPSEKGSKTFRIDLQDKSILTSEAYFLLPNDVVIIEPQPQKIFNLNLPTLGFIITSVTSAITTTVLLVNYLK